MERSGMERGAGATRNGAARGAGALGVGVLLAVCAMVFAVMALPAFAEGGKTTPGEGATVSASGHDIGKLAPGQRAVSLDAAASSIRWIGRKVGGSHDGTIPVCGGGFVLDAQGRPVSLSVEADPTGITSFHKKLSTHLRSEDFLFTKRFPSAKFLSTKLTKRSGDCKRGKARYTVEGSLTVRGVSKPVTFPATLTCDAKGVRGEAKLTIDRVAFGITHDGISNRLIKNDVTLTIKLASVR